MSKGSIIMKEVIRLIKSEKNSQENIQPTCQNLSELDRKPSHKEQGKQKAIKISKKERNLLSRVLKIMPNISSSHIYKLFGFMGLNLRAIEDQSFQESFFKTYLHGRVVEKVEVYQYAVLVDLAAPQFSSQQMSITQLIENFKRKGCMKFYELSKQIQEVLALFKMMEGVESKPQKSQCMKKWLDLFGDSKFVLTSGMRKIAISKQLLTYLGYDIEEFCLEAIKFRGIFAELFSADSYYPAFLYMLSVLKYTVQLTNNKLSLAEFRDLATYHYTGFIYSKNYTKSYCDFMFSFLTPSVMVHKIKHIHYKEKQKKLGKDILAIEEEKDRVRQEEYQVIKKIKTIPSSLLKENQQMITGYKRIRQEEESNTSQAEDNK